MIVQLARWEPDNPFFWQTEGERVARRNLAVSVAALVLAFAVWMMWSTLAALLPHAGFRFTTSQLFWLVAAPGLAGATLRFLFAFAVPLVGGRTWTVLSTLLLLVPTVGFAVAVRDPGTAYPTFLLLALACGIGGGNFASSMANISFFYPAERKGTALGTNAGLGNLGVPLAQFALPLVVASALFGAVGGAPQPWHDGTAAQLVWLQNAGLAFVLPILVVAALAWRWMDDLAPIRASIDEQAAVVARPDTWLLAWLYLGSFGSFIGFAAGFPLLVTTDFAGVDVAGFAFAGPLAAALMRPLGGWLADRAGGGRVALACFAAMGAAVAGLIALAGPGARLAPFLALFGVLFVASGIGNGAVFQLIPAVFAARRRAQAPHGSGTGEVARAAAVEGAAALGFASAIAALGAFVIPKAYGTAVELTGATTAALWLFLLFYVSCVAVTWRHYLRPASPVAPPAPRAPQR
jgi:NNP family nitrate/nitrite transporter-like MFS transporter